jgi:hypothetical protein
MTASTPSCWAIPCATWRQLPVPSPLLAEIKALTRDRDRLLETQRAVESQLRMILEAYRPAPVRLFSSVDRQITLHFVTTPQPQPRTSPRGSRLFVVAALAEIGGETSAPTAMTSPAS